MTTVYKFDDMMLDSHCNGVRLLELVLQALCLVLGHFNSPSYYLTDCHE